MNRHDAWYGHFDLLQNQHKLSFDPELDQMKTIASGFSMLFLGSLFSLLIQMPIALAEKIHGKGIEELIHSVPDFELFLSVLYIGYAFLTVFLVGWGTWQISRSPRGMERHRTGSWMFISWTVGVVLHLTAVVGILVLFALHPEKDLNDLFLVRVLNAASWLGRGLIYIAGVLFFPYAFSLANIVPESRSYSALESSVYGLGAYILSLMSLPFLVTADIEAMGWIWITVTMGFYFWFLISLLCAYRFLASDLRKYVKREERREMEEHREAE